MGHNWGLPSGAWPTKQHKVRAASPSYMGGTRGSALPLAPFSSTTEFSSSDASLAASIRCSAACAHAHQDPSPALHAPLEARCVCSLRMLHIVCCKLRAHSLHFKALHWLRVHCGRGDPSLSSQPWYGVTHHAFAPGRTDPSRSSLPTTPAHGLHHT